MGGTREVSHEYFNQLITALNCAIKSYQKATDSTSTFQPRMQIPNIELRTDNLINPYVTEKEGLDRVYAPDTSLINLFFMAYGLDLSDLNLHTGPYAEEITRNAGAEALTSGKDIYFSSGSYTPYTDDGEALLLHEIEHVHQNEKGMRIDFGEDVNNAEREASNRERLKGQDLFNSNHFERWKQEDLIFKNKELTDGLNAVEKDLADYTDSDPIEIYRYICTSGRVIEMTKDEYEECLVQIVEKLEDYFDEKMKYGTEEEKQRIMNNMVSLFNM